MKRTLPTAIVVACLTLAPCVSSSGQSIVVSSGAAASRSGAPAGHALADAAEKTDRARTSLLLKQRVDVNRPDVDGMTALHWAAQANDLRTATLLIAAGANVNAVTSRGKWRS